ncbi:MAG: hypothetical protein AAFO94_22025 [Bacteroidota bacterium]
MPEGLHQIFQHLITSLSTAPPADKWWQELERHYTQSNRHYHNLSHLESMLQQMEACTLPIEDRELLQFSIFYHDLIYKSTRKDNELQSAKRACEVLKELGFEKERIERCHHQIMLTQNHTTSAEDKTDEQLIIDFDLEVLSREWEAYHRYSQQIRKEYSIYPGFLYRKGRKKALQHFLERPFIYQTEMYRAAWEAKARENIEREIELL